MWVFVQYSIISMFHVLLCHCVNSLQIYKRCCFHPQTWHTWICDVSGWKVSLSAAGKCHTAPLTLYLLYTPPTCPHLNIGVEKQSCSPYGAESHQTASWLLPPGQPRHALQRSFGLDWDLFLCLATRNWQTIKMPHMYSVWLMDSLWLELSYARRFMI